MDPASPVSFSFHHVNFDHAEVFKRVMDLKYCEVSLQAGSTRSHCYVCTFFDFFVELVFQSLDRDNFTIDEREILSLILDVPEIQTQPVFLRDGVV